MLRSLVGSEMCIRDRSIPTIHDIKLIADSLAKKDVKCKAVSLAIKIMLTNGVRVGFFQGCKVSYEGDTLILTNENKGQVIKKQIKFPVNKTNLKTLQQLKTHQIKETINYHFNKFYTGAGIKSRAYKRQGYSHAIRHRFAIDLYMNSGCDIELVRRALGHADIRITTTYLRGIIDR